MNCSEETKQQLVVNEHELIKYLNEKCEDFVLLVDELNMLSLQLDEEVNNFLKENFMDKKGRYFVFTTHQPLSFDRPNAIAQRGCEVLNLSQSTDIRTLRHKTLHEVRHKT